MTSQLTLELEKALPEGLVVPEELRALHAWIEQYGATQRIGGKTCGFLWPSAISEDTSSLLPDDSEVDEVVLSCANLVFEAIDHSEVSAWIHVEAKKAEAARLAFIASSDGDGSRVGLWRDDRGRQHFVFLGSGSGSTMACVLARRPLSFLRLIAIGYPELGEVADFSKPPLEEDDSVLVENERLRDWVEQTFETTIPKNGGRFVRTRGSQDVRTPGEDPFHRWLLEVQDGA